ncbi:MAG: hypothetical protein V4617_20445 [Gemmatimonadota bacterium]
MADPTSRPPQPGGQPEVAVSPPEPARVAVAAPADPMVRRAALERVLARATELQGTGSDAPEAISESRLLEIAREVGIDANHVRQALAEERAGQAFGESESGFLLDSLGSAHVDAQRAVPGTSADVQARIEAWMPRMESLSVRRKSPQRVSWEPRQTVLGSALRVMSSGNRAELVRADQVVATVTPVDESRSVVRFDVELNGLRRTQRNLAVGFGVVANAAAFATVAVPVGFIAAGTGNEGLLGGGLAVLGALQAGAGYAIWRGLKNSYRRTVARVQLRVEQMLDELEHGGMQSPPSLLKQVRGALLGE